MDIFKTLRLIVVLFGATCLFCWVLTSHWMFGPIVTIAAFFGGTLLLSLLGLLVVYHE